MNKLKDEVKKDVEAITEPKGPERGPAPPNAERRGLWKVLTVSLVLAVIALVVVATSVG